MATLTRRIVRKVFPERFRPAGILRRQLERETGGTAIAGPFHGLKLGTILRYRRFAHAFMLGTFEREIQPWIERAIELEIPRIVNVGSADGYYAIGMCLRMPEVEMIAFEMDAGRRDKLRYVAELNGVLERLDIRGFCEPEDLQAALAEPGGPSLVMSDVEGHEEVILDPERVPALRGSYVIVEVHEHFVPGIRAELHRRFEGTHELVDIPQQPRRREDVDYHSFLTDRLPRIFDLERVLREPRAKADSWMWMAPR